MIEIRKPAEGEFQIFVDLVRELAEFEKLKGPERDEELRLERDYREGRYELLLAFREEEPVGYAVFYETYSTFLAKRTLFLEDLYVRDKWRRSGVGSHIFRKIVESAAERRCGRIEWSVLRWNSAAKHFYERKGAKQLSEWELFRLNSEDFKKVMSGAEGEI